MTTTDTTPAVQAADVLDKAAEHLLEVGLHKGYLYDEQQALDGLALNRCKVDAVGAILAAAYGQPRYPATEPVINLTDIALDALEAKVGAPPVVWNDETERTVDEVFDALAATAARLRESV
ncbi:hypothetical protein [Streptomyces sp. NBC_01373]|uniref:DUF6197 family protein n=1 Tax=Streptomyces sp. NBC_01373 TaxID=2903843 RepID=UPI00224E5452|nr:hypothetical protein [Streptomyces sp. NBC_01373]MCX4697053.1 hypothetical protein [Streptomyces sp. NBC_01373]MCX4707022.1 hypothetical protein [Streptomyces sp. NBC_01373]